MPQTRHDGWHAGSEMADSTIECAHSCRPPLRPRARLRIDAHSDPSGENPTGSASFVSLDFGLVLASGPVTRLEVTGNSAIVGFDDDEGPVQGRRLARLHRR
jgi:hypothetical protein